jgi:hypothetical protein
LFGIQGEIERVGAISALFEDEEGHMSIEIADENSTDLRLVLELLSGGELGGGGLVCDGERNRDTGPLGSAA